MPCPAAHPRIAHIREYPSPDKHIHCCSASLTRHIDRSSVSIQLVCKWRDEASVSITSQKGV